MSTSAGIAMQNANGANYELGAEDFVNKTCAIIGRSGSGKTTIIKHILWLTRKYIPTTISFSQSDSSNKVYQTMTHQSLTYPDVQENVLRSIMTRQERVVELFNIAHDVNTLESLCHYSSSARDALAETKRSSEKAFAQLQQGMQSHSDEIAAMRAKFDVRYIKILRQIIRSNMHEIASMALCEKERICVKFFDINPRIVIIFDDCTTGISGCRSSQVLQEFFYRGRHLHCTMILSIHDDAALSRNMRRNLRVLFLTDETTALTYANRKSNDLAPHVADEIRAKSKMILLREPFTKMQCVDDIVNIVRVPLHETFDALSPHVRELCEATTKKIDASASGVKSWMRDLL